MPKEMYKANRSAFIDGVFVGVALTVVSQYALYKYTVLKRAKNARTSSQDSSTE